MKPNNPFCICPLASGSRGNSLFISTPDTALLVDAGLSGKEIERRMAVIGQAPETLSAIIITHEHSDHIRGAGILSRRFKVPVYVTPRTFSACQGLGKIDRLTHFECGTPFDVGSIRINPFSISHDAADPVGMTLGFKEKKIGVATDLGIATTLVKEHLKNCHALYLESNHDPDMLINGPYPWHLKQRIKSRCGHLSNADAKNLVSELLHPDLHHIILAHLSEENNHPGRALQEVSKGLNGLKPSLCVAMPHEPGRMIRL